MLRVIVIVLAGSALGGCAVSDGDEQQVATPGIARGMARGRARRVSGVTYGLRFDLRTGADAVQGSVALNFDATGSGDLVLDFGGEDLSDVTLNGSPVDATLQDQHLILPAALLRQERNTFSARFASRVATTGTPLTTYRDTADGREYLYTLVVPADAHRLFPCFDQPDVKASFALELEVPGDWTAVANGAETVGDAPGGRRRFTFAATPPLPTYLFAFAAGPFATVDAPASFAPTGGLRRPMRVFVRPGKRKDTDTDALFALHQRSVAWQENYFDYDYPFEKLDIVLCPGFPYGGMEHAGAIFYRETALVFDHRPTELELLRRSTLVYHEVSHQWFGNLVTMEWFDDLWLKEGFATFVGYRTLEELEPDTSAWLRFHQRVKPSAYRIDVTEGTTPIWQELGNLADAKSAYGPIVYNKAPAVLRQLEQTVGPTRFRAGVRAFLKRHAFGNATWQDLLAAIGTAAETDLGPWSRRWILDRGVPRIIATWSEGAVRVRQEDVLGAGRTWPLVVSVLAGLPDGSRRLLRIDCSTGEGTSRELTSRPAFLLPNADDVAFTQVILDEPSLAWWLRELPSERDRLVKAVAFSAVWESVRESRCAPGRFCNVALELLATERDPQAWSSTMAAFATTVQRYLRPDESEAPKKRASDLLERLLVDPSANGIRLMVLRRFLRLAQSDAHLSHLERILDGAEPVSGLELGRRDRFSILTALLAAQRPGVEDRLARLQRGPTDVARWVYQARAAVPTAANKQTYYASFLKADEPPEQWVSGALGSFHWSGQDALTLPYLRRALESAEWVKAHRKIFFMPAWLESFLGAHASAEALTTVEGWLRERPDLPPDIRRKLLVPLHELRRAVRIRSASR